MRRFFALAHRIPAVYRRTSLLLSLAAAALVISAGAHAQFGPSAPETPVHDPSALKPPPGAHVAIIEFSDFECPMCGISNPVIKEAAEKYHIPWLRHDFPLAYHPWSFSAAVNAHWFDIKSKALGDEYRDTVFANQASIFGLYGLRQFTEEFAKSHGVVLPFAVDPQGTLAAEVKADYALGQRIGVEHTPTIWIVTAGSKGPPYIEVVDRSKLFQIIDQAIADTTPAKSASVRKLAKR
jgi:protein-disulfide isomerase